MLVLRLQLGKLLLVRCRASIDRQLPFELRVLEGALSGVMQELGAEITELIDTAVPALDALICHVGLPHGCSLPSNVLLTVGQRSEHSRSVLPALRSQAHQTCIAPASCDLSILTDSWRGGQILHTETSSGAPVQSRAPGIAGVQAGAGDSPDSEESPAGAAIPRQPHQTRTFRILPMHISDERRVACSRSASFSFLCQSLTLPVQMEARGFLQR